MSLPLLLGNYPLPEFMESDDNSADFYNRVKPKHQAFSLTASFEKRVFKKPAAE